MSYSRYFLDQQRNKVDHTNYYFFKDAFNPDEINEIKRLGGLVTHQDGTVVSKTDGEITSDFRRSQIAWLEMSNETEWIYEKMAYFCKLANEGMWNFDVWGYQDAHQYTIYHETQKGHYDWHMDVGPGISNRKISCVLQLSDASEYEGGELQINNGGIMTVPKQSGTICFFPSFLLHRVTPVTKGVRHSLVNWFCGANFR